MALPKLIVVLGTTACGKSGLGVELAKRFGGEIVSADSRQVYRGLDLGTGKVTEEEMEGVPHHMLDVVGPNQPYSVAEFQAGAYAAIDGILSWGTPLPGGGNRAVRPGGDRGLHLHRRPARPGPSGEAGGKDHSGALRPAAGKDRRHPHRRGGVQPPAAYALGGEGPLRPVGEPPPRPRYDCLLLGVTFPGTWCAAALTSGSRPAWTPEWWRRWPPSRAGGADDSFLEGLGLEYRYILWYLTGKIPTLDALKDELGRAIKRFAKRQMVWFQKDRDVLWLDMEVDFLTQAVRAVEDFLA